MVQERINAWMTANSTSEVPANIIYYRDGVSEGKHKLGFVAALNV
tara:strand:- start:57465 stop:57599 length:135 start_codon:yes stop_codon:yes gene_type:complete